MTMSVREIGRQMLSIAGETELLKAFDSLANKESRRITRKVLFWGSREMRDEIKFQIRPAKTRGHTSRALKNNIGAKLKRQRKADEYQAAAGVGVGKKKPKSVPPGTKSTQSNGGAPHLHLQALGSAPRWTGRRTWRTKKGGLRSKPTGKPVAYRGRMPADDFVGRAYAARGGKVTAEMLAMMRTEIEASAAKGANS